MRGSLQDQLLKSGIATTDQLKKARPSSKKKSKHQSKQKPHSKSNKDRSENRAKTPYVAKTTPKPVEPVKEVTLGKALRAEIKKLLKTNKQNDKTGEIPYNYVINSNVKRFYITPAQQKSLQSGEMVIVNWNTISYLISKETEVELRKLHPTIEVAGFEQESETKKPDEANENDPYSDYKIPDDLSW